MYVLFFVLIIFNIGLDYKVCTGQTNSPTVKVVLAPNHNRTFDCFLPSKTMHEVAYLIHSDSQSVEWTKTQNVGQHTDIPLVLNELVMSTRSDLPESMRNNIDISIGSSLNANIQLTLKNVRQQESGQYLCTFKDNDVVVARYSYDVQVLAPVSELILYGFFDASVIPSNPDTSVWEHQPILNLTADQNGYLACVSRGSYPGPALQVYIGNKEITDMTTNSFATLLGNRDYQKVYRSTVEASTRTLRVTRIQNGTTIRCKARLWNGGSVYQTLETSAILYVQENTVPILSTTSTSTTSRATTPTTTIRGTTESPSEPNEIVTTILPDLQETTIFQSSNAAETDQDVVPMEGQPDMPDTNGNDQNTLYMYIIIGVVVVVIVIGATIITVVVLVQRKRREPHPYTYPPGSSNMSGPYWMPSSQSESGYLHFPDSNQPPNTNSNMKVKERVNIYDEPSDPDYVSIHGDDQRISTANGPGIQMNPDPDQMDIPGIRRGHSQTVPKNNVSQTGTNVSNKYVTHNDQMITSTNGHGNYVTPDPDQTNIPVLQRHSSQTPPKLMGKQQSRRVSNDYLTPI